MRVVDVAMLVGQAVAGVVPQALDVAAELVGAGDARVGGRHLVPVVDGIHKLVDRKRRLDGVLERELADQVGGRLRLALAGVGARQADLAERDRDHADRAGRLLAVGVALRAPALGDERRLGVLEVACQLADLVSGNLGDLGCPFRRLLGLVLALAHDVGLVGEVLALGGLGHGVLVPADGVLAQERLVGLAVDDELVDERGRQRGVGTRADGEPFVDMARRGLVQAVVDVDDLSATTGHRLAHAGEIPRRVGAAHAGLCRRVAKQHDQVRMRFGLAERRRVDVVVRREDAALLLVGAEHVGHDDLQHMRRVVGTLVDEAAEQAQQTLARVAARGAVHARRVVDEDGLGAVGPVDVLELVVDGLDCLIPADALELALAALADALHRVQQAVGMVDPLAHAATAQARTRLEVGIADVVGFHVLDLAVFGVPLEDAVDTAVQVALAPRDGLLGGLLGGVGNELVARLSQSSAGRDECCERARSLDERSAVQAHVWHIVPSFLSCIQCLKTCPILVRTRSHAVT